MKPTMHRTIIFILFFLSTTFALKAQTFRLGLITGMNISKLSGDDNSFNYLGFKYGGRVGVDLHRQIRTSIDLLYNRKGNIVSQSRSTEIYKNVRLDYVEIPFKLTVMDWMDDPDEEDYYKLHFVVGTSFSRLVNYKASDNQDFDVTNDQQFNKSMLSILGGLVYYPREHWGINLQYSHSLSSLEKSDLCRKRSLEIGP